MGSENAVEINDLKYSWDKNSKANLINVSNLEIKKGETVFVYGRSGCGKTTLLSLLAGVLDFESGSVNVLGVDLKNLSAAKRDSFRADNLGVVFQMFNLLPYMSVIENVTLGCEFSKVKRSRISEIGASIESEARRLLAALGFSDENFLNKEVSKLSVGQQQRVAVARALLGKPGLLICDEPTSALDETSRDSFMNLMMAEAAKAETAVVFVSHDDRLKKYFDRTLSFDSISEFAQSEAQP